MSPEEYRALCKANGVKVPRQKPELKLQISCAEWFRTWLRPDVCWIAGAAGLPLTSKVLADGKASGVLEPGWPDLSLLSPHDGFTRFIELKIKASLTDDQRAFRDVAQRFGLWALCRTREAVISQVTAWGLVREGAPCR